jgi:CHRD domain
MRRLEVGGKWMIALAITALIVSGCSQTSSRTSQGQSSMGQVGDAKSATLTGAQEVPAVNTQATGVSTIQVFGDKNVTGSIQTSNIDGTAAHIHQGAAGQNGPVIIPLVKTAPNVWSVQPNTQLSSAQFDAYRAGELYVNVHSAAHPGGEIRAQLNRP